MSYCGWLKDKACKPPVKRGARSLRRVSAWIGLSLGALVLAVAVFSFGFRGAILNRYGKEKVERAFAEAYPGCSLRIDALDYVVGANRMVAQSVVLSATNAALKAGRISLTGVPWGRLIWGTAGLSEVLAEASLEATNIEVELPKAQFQLRCARLRARAPSSELIAEGIEFKPSMGDEELFAGKGFRTTAYHALIPECRVLGLAYADLLQGKSYTARSVHLERPSLAILVNCDKPAPPVAASPLMAHEALAQIRQPLRVDSLTLANGRLTYSEREVLGAHPAVLTFGAVSMSLAGIANRGGATAALSLKAQGNLMDAGTMTVQMVIPVTPPDFSLHYSGSLSAMDLTCLDAFLDIAEHTRIKSGRVQQAKFDIAVVAGQASGRVGATYSDLGIALLDKETGSANGVGNRFASLLANLLKIRKSNAPSVSGSMKEGMVDYTRKPDDTFVQFLWFSLRSGLLDVITH